MAIGYKYSELLLFKLTCANSECSQSFHEVIGELAGRDSTHCPSCGAAVDLIGDKRLIEELMRIAAEFDKTPD